MKIYKKLNHFAVQLKLMQHCKSTIFQLKKKTWKKKKPKKFQETNSKMVCLKPITLKKRQYKLA